jgi:hypothetical protein
VIVFLFFFGTMVKYSSMEESTSSPSPRVPKKRTRASASEAKSSFAARCSSGHLAPWGVAVAAIVVLALVVFGVIAVPGAKHQSWNAVFLTNGQVYFGQTTSQTPSTLVLEKVYYLEVAPSLQQGDAEASASDLTLVKLGNELHAPTDMMRINREHILFTEELQEDGAVAQAIQAAQSGVVPRAEGSSAGEALPDPPSESLPVSEGVGASSDPVNE